MKVLIVNTNDINGGAARAAYRLHQSLISADINSQMLVITKQSDDRAVLPFSQNIGRVGKLLRRLQFLFLDKIRNYPNRTKTLFSPSYLKHSGVVDKINEINPDIVHLHWICNEMISVEDIAKIKAPIVWSLHDMWAFTGGCHYDEGCGRFAESCGKCKVLGSADERDLSKSVFDRKQKTFSKIDKLTLVGLSNWIAESAKKSSLFSGRRVVTIPNPICSDIFRAVDKGFSRDVLGLPKEKKLVLFGAMSATSDPRKGIGFLKRAMNKLQADDVEIVIFGSGEPENPINFGFKTHYVGVIKDDLSLRVLYSACDVMVVPSLQENLSNAIMESLSCATPVVCFSIGGNADLVSHKENGYLAKALDDTDLAKGIDWLLSAVNYDELCVNARDVVLQKFDESKVVKEYITFYEQVLS